MDRKSVGTVVIVDEDRAPLGIITDRDLCCRVVAAGRDPDETQASDIMSKGVATANRRDSLDFLLAEMKKRRIRRMPVVDEGRLVGILSLDDLTLDISSHLFQLSETPSVQMRESRRGTRARRRRESLDSALDEVRHQIRHAGENVRTQLGETLEDLARRLREGR